MKRLFHPERFDQAGKEALSTAQIRGVWQPDSDDQGAHEDG
jgi:hypothetical protein